MAHNSERKSNAKDILKQAAPCWIISFALCFMLFLYEPIMMYVTNKDNFWFDFGIVIKPILMIFLIFFAGTAAILTGLYFICRKFSENVKPYRIILTVIFVCFIVLYIQKTVWVVSMIGLLCFIYREIYSQAIFLRLTARQSTGARILPTTL